MDLERAVVVQSFATAATAEAAVGLLQSEGIDAMVRADDAGGTLPNLDLVRGAKVLVDAQNEERARELLNAGLDESETGGSDDTGG